MFRLDAFRILLRCFLVTRSLDESCRRGPIRSCSSWPGQVIEFTRSGVAAQSSYEMVIERLDVEPQAPES